MRRLTRLGWATLAIALVACGLDVVGVEPEAVPAPIAEAGPLPADARPTEVERDATIADAGPDVRDAAPAPCPDGSIETPGQCFVLVTGRSQPAAKEACAEAGAVLATVRNATEQALLAEAGAGGDLWLGLEAPENSQNDAAAYHWLSGDPSTYRNWSPGDPNNNHPCVRMMGAPPNAWGDIDCNTSIAVVCERDR